LIKYCAALANEGGGKIILGVTDRPPRRVVGSQALLDLERAKAGIVERLRLRIEAAELCHPDGRVVVIEVPARPLGVPIAFEGTYWMRSGQDVVAMTNDRIKRIFDETVPDFSAEICPKATMDDLDRSAIQELRARWHRKSGNEALKNVSDEQLLSDAELVFNGQVTYAALILLGTQQALGRHLAQAEVIFEYRSSEASGPAQQREEYRRGFLLFFDDLWNKINLRNDLQHFQHRLVVLPVPTFDEHSVREAILNAVSHRDYRSPGSVFIRQFSRRIEFVSPGGLPEPVTPQNILSRQMPRNRRIADVFGKCGLVERAGQGFNLIYEHCIRQSKPLPDFKGTDEYQVALTLHGEMQDPKFLSFLESIAVELRDSFSTQDWLALDQVHRLLRVEPELQPNLLALLQHRIIEPLRGETESYILSPRLYDYSGKQMPVSLHREVERAAYKATLLEYLVANQAVGSQFGELMKLLPSLSRRQVQALLKELKDERRAHPIGRTRTVRWYPGQ
jgi:ATP-dependent DNA helicase RecG